VLEQLTQARALAAAPASGPAQRAEREDQVSAAVVRSLAVAESSPELRSSESFLSLGRELSATEDRLASARRFYNANVREINVRVETFPSSIVAKLSGFSRAEYFESSGGPEGGGDKE